MSKTLASIVAVSLACLPVTPVIAAKPLQKVSPATAPFVIEGLQPDDLLKRMQGRAGAYPINYILYTTVECDVPKNKRCEGTVALTAPSGWQVCAPLYQVSYYGGYDKEVRVTPALFYPNDPLSPDRFSRYEIYIRAGGNGFDQGARVTLSQVGVSLLPFSMDNYDRAFYHCQQPNHG